MTIKFVKLVHFMTRIATISLAFLISAACTIVSTNSARGSSLTDPGGRSLGSTEWGNDGGEVMESITSLI